MGCSGRRRNTLEQSSGETEQAIAILETGAEGAARGENEQHLHEKIQFARHQH
jgi:hypothetical protein